MLYYIKKYPVSLLIILTVIYLSFFKPPTTDLSNIPNIDKIVHVCMYLGMSGMLWLEFLRAHQKGDSPLWHAWVGAFVCPVLFSGMVELLQEYCTLSWGRLAGLCCKYNRSADCFADRIFCITSANGKETIMVIDYK